jgi:hypothetical protein
MCGGRGHPGSSGTILGWKNPVNFTGIGEDLPSKASSVWHHFGHTQETRGGVLA